RPSAVPDNRQAWLALDRGSGKERSTPIAWSCCVSDRPRKRTSWPAETFGAEVARYLESKSTVLKARTIIETNRHLLVYAKPLHHLRLSEIDRRTIAVRLAEIEHGSGGATRNRVRSSLSAFFAFAIREGLIEVNPVTGTGKANEGNGRDRVLSEPELSAVLKALGQDDFSDVVRLLVLTGQRREEIGSLRWSEIDWDRGLIVLPPERTKNKRLHELPMSTQVRSVLDRRRLLKHPRYGSAGAEWVFG